MTPENHHKLLTSKELADALKRSPNYVYKMRSLGFKMPGGVATVAEARAWLTIHPHPRKRVPTNPTKG